MLMLFPRFDKLLTTKNTNATFFSSRRKYFFGERFYINFTKKQWDNIT